MRPVHCEPRTARRLGAGRPYLLRESLRAAALGGGRPSRLSSPEGAISSKPEASTAVSLAKVVSSFGADPDSHPVKKAWRSWISRLQASCMEAASRCVAGSRCER